MRPKICKSNPKCKFDYVESKCKYKPVPSTESKKNPNPLITVKKIGSRRKSMPTRKTFKKTSKKTSKKKSTRGVREQTTDVFKELIKSFKRIGNEAEKDANLLKRATQKIKL